MLSILKNMLHDPKPSAKHLRQMTAALSSKMLILRSCSSFVQKQ